MSQLLQKPIAAKSDGPPASENNNNSKKSRNSNKETSQESDSFYKYYNKEIKVNQEEIPIVLYELVDAAYNYIQRESYEKALILLQKTENVLEVVSLESSKRDKYIAYTTFHNMAMCYQKLGMLDECFVYLKECLSILTASQKAPGEYFYKFNSENCVAARMKQIRQECKIKLQLCAILSQTQNHTEALDNAKKSVKLIHQLFKDLQALCALYIRKIELKEGNNQKEGDEEKPSNAFLDESISLMERTAIKMYPVIKEVKKRLIEERSSQEEELKVDPNLLMLTSEGDPSAQADMRSILGFLNQNEWVFQLNIGNIMQLQPVNLRTDMLSQCRNECELSRDAFLEKIALLSVAYFCVSTEMRFILQSREQYLSSPVKKQRELESEYWHAKSLEVAVSFLPSECPLLNHILLSYQKHHDPTNQPIKEDQEQTDLLSVIRPIQGIESSKYQPIVRQIQNIKVQITPCNISPVTKRVFSFNKINQSSKLTRVKQISDCTVSSGLSSGAQNIISQDININQKHPQMKDEVEIVMFDQQQQESQAQAKQLQQLPTSHHHLMSSSQLYSDEYYDQFVKKIFDENPQLDRKQLVTKFLSHLQSQDFSFLQQQINEQHLLGDGFEDEDIIGNSKKSEMQQKEQRSTLIDFGDAEEVNTPLSHNSSLISDKPLQKQPSLSKNGDAGLHSIDFYEKQQQPKKKLMSYLEGGDSILKEIQRSLQNQNINLDEEDDEEIMLEDQQNQLYVRNQRSQDDRHQQQLTAQDFELINESDIPHTKIQFIHHTSQSDDGEEEIDSNDADDEEEMKFNNQNIGRYASNPMANQSHLRNKRPQTAINLSESLRNRRGKQQQFISYQQHHEDEGSPVSQPSSHRSEEHRQKLASIIVQQQQQQQQSHSGKKKKQQLKVAQSSTHKSQQAFNKKVILNGILTNTSSNAGFGKKSQNKNAIMMAQKSTNSLSGTRNRSKSSQKLGGVSTNNFSTHQHFKSMAPPQMIQSRQSHKNLKKRKNAKSSEDERRSSSSKKSVGTFSRPQSSQQHYNLRNKRGDNSSADKNDMINNPENFTPGTMVRGSIIPIVPTSGEKHPGELKHLHSFDQALYNSHNPRPGTHQSISSLQQQVLDNQRVIMQFQKSQCGRQSQQRRHKENQEQKQPSAGVQQPRVKSCNGFKRSSAGASMSTSAGGTASFNTFLKQKLSICGGLVDQKSSFLNTNKENNQIQINKRKGGVASSGAVHQGVTNSGTKKRSLIRELATGLLQHQKSFSKEMVANKQSGFSRNFEGNNSPQTQDNQKRSKKANKQSQSPPRKLAGHLEKKPRPHSSCGLSNNNWVSQSFTQQLHKMAKNHNVVFDTSSSGRNLHQRNKRINNTFIANNNHQSFMKQSFLDQNIEDEMANNISTNEKMQGNNLSTMIEHQSTTANSSLLQGYRPSFGNAQPQRQTQETSNLIHHGDERHASANQLAHVLLKQLKFKKQQPQQQPQQVQPPQAKLPLQLLVQAMQQKVNNNNRSQQQSNNNINNQQTNSAAHLRIGGGGAAKHHLSSVQQNNMLLRA